MTIKKLRDRSSNESWTTVAEMNFISYLSSDEPRDNGHVPTIVERRNKLVSWLKTSKIRVWPKKINVLRCQEHAKALYAAL